MKIQEIAALAGVSAATVSRVFSNHPKISAEVRERVLAIAREHHYHPRLPSKQRNVVIIIPDESGYPAHYCVEMLVMSLSSELSKHNFRVEILPWTTSERLKSIQFYAAAAIGIDAAEFQNWNREFHQPLVVLDRKLPQAYPGVWQVSSDEYGAMEMAVEHFRNHGIQRIGCLIFGTPGVGNADLRFQAAKAAMEKYSYPCDDAFFGYASQENCVEMVGKMLSRNVDALLCPGSSGGLLTAYALNLFGKKVGEDISIISTEMTFFSPYATPPQTTLSPDYLQIAAMAVDIFLAVLDGRSKPSRTMVPYHLIKRESVCSRKD